MTVDDLRAQAMRLLETVGPMLDPSARPVAGVGGHANGLRGAWISRRQAMLSAEAARRLGTPDGVGIWDELGELAVLVQLPDDALVVRSWAAPLGALVAHESGVRLCATLRCFLDNAGSVPRTAAALHLHRTSLYYRLGQIRDITGLDLDDGRNRLLLHLGLRLADLGFPTE
jgi:sugar diacid utilization regulator